MPRLLDRIGVAVAVLATGLFCYLLAMWLGYVPGETAKAEDVLLAGSLALIVIGVGLDRPLRRLTRLRLIVRIAAGVGLVGFFLVG